MIYKYTYTLEKIHNMKEKYCYLSLLAFNNQKGEVVWFTNTGSVYQRPVYYSIRSWKGKPCAKTKI